MYMIDAQMPYDERFRDMTSHFSKLPRLCWGELCGGFSLEMKAIKAVKDKFIDINKFRSKASSNLIQSIHPSILISLV